MEPRTVPTGTRLIALIARSLVAAALAVVAGAAVPAGAGASPGPGGAFVDLTASGGESRAVRLAPRGALVGNSAPAPDGTYTGFVRFPDGATRSLGPLGPHAQALDDQGDAVGCTAAGTGLYWHDDTLTYLTRPGRSTCLYAINDRGEIAGASAAPGGGERAFVWRNGVYTDLATPAGRASTPIAINERGQVLARVFGVTASVPIRATLWTDGRPADVGEMVPSALNDDGVVVGTSNGHPIRWADGRSTDLLPAGGSNVSVADVNRAGDVVGTVNDRPALWHDGRLTYLADAGEATAINDRGDVTGVVRAGDVPTVFRWRHGTLRRLPNPPGTTYCYPVGVDSSGTVAGNVTVGNVNHAVLWT
ncbi:hypothetical protein [Cryptosporangium phraense]|uniref:HAF repeat-containing protein n=1 Tax=Cryptosporangium phraense TaxID=2593070 RepID=A0A545AHX2_9ACTN|nr:hypothetical protein [Cryptosporangium phraense]TQS40924.1 hypothetical protein FL583_32390 [Cryptosporangium phraense]